jgi:hypothetical protein
MFIPLTTAARLAGTNARGFPLAGATGPALQADEAALAAP